MVSHWKSDILSGKFRGAIVTVNPQGTSTGMTIESGFVSSCLSVSLSQLSNGIGRNQNFTDGLPLIGLAVHQARRMNLKDPKRRLGVQFPNQVGIAIRQHDVMTTPL